MNDCAYYSITIALYALIAFLAATAENVDVIFDFNGCICVNALGFALPAIFYLMGALY